MSGIYDVTLAPGASQNLAVLGDYFKVRKCPYGSIDVKIDGGDSYSMDEGLGVRLNKPFRDLTIRNRSSLAQTVLIFIGDSRFEDTRISGSVRVIDEITENIVAIGIGAPVTIATFTATALIAPALNLNGMILRGAVCDITAGVGATAYADLRLVACKSAPTNYALPAQQFPFCVASASNGARGLTDKGFINKFIPPGWGIFYTRVISVIDAQNMALNLFYELQ